MDRISLPTRQRVALLCLLMAELLLLAVMAAVLVQRALVLPAGPAPPGQLCRMSGLQASGTPWPICLHAPTPP